MLDGPVQDVEILGRRKFRGLQGRADPEEEEEGRGRQAIGNKDPGAG